MIPILIALLLVWAGLTVAGLLLKAAAWLVVVALVLFVITAAALGLQRAR